MHKDQMHCVCSKMLIYDTCPRDAFFKKVKIEKKERNTKYRCLYRHIKRESNAVSLLAMI